MIGRYFKFGLLSMTALSNANRKYQGHTENRSTGYTTLDKANRNLELVSVQIFFRHGARTPVHLINQNTKSMPQAFWEPSLLTKTIQGYRDLPTQVVDLDGKPVSDQDGQLEKMYQSKVLPGGEKSGQLTRQGQEQLFKMGLQYQQRYGDLVDTVVKANFSNLYCRSSRIRRNIHSMECLLTGLFQGKASESTIKIHTTETECEILYPNFRFCETLVTFFYRGIKNSNENSTFQESKDYLKSILEVNDLMSMLSDQEARLGNIKDDFHCRHFHGFKISKEMEEYLPRLSRLSAEQMSYEVFGGPVKENLPSLTFNVGVVLHMIVKTFEEIRSGASDYKLKLYATHDTLIIPLLVSLGVLDYDFPPFGSDLIFEMYRDSTSGEYWLQVLYLGEPLVLNHFCEDRDDTSTLIPVEIIEKHFLQYALSLEEYKVRCKSQPYRREDKEVEERVTPPGL